MVTCFGKICEKYRWMIPLLGFSFVSLGILATFFTEKILSCIVSSNLLITPRKELIYNYWKDVPVPVVMNFYLFNWTNPEDLRKPNIKPRLKEMGPYRFIEQKRKVGIVLHDNKTVSYKQIRTWHFDENNSVGFLDENITSLNPLALTAAHVASKDFGYWLQKTLSLSLSSVYKHIYITKTAREWLFDGYEDKLLNMIRTVPSLSSLGLSIPPFDRVGWFAGRNGSADIDGTYSIGTGEGSVPIGQIDRFNNRRENNYYEAQCNDIRGSTGEIAKQFQVENEIIEVYQNEICRVCTFDYSGPQKYRGVNGFRYVLGKKFLDNGTLYPENKCYCKDNATCPRSGVISISACNYGAPGFISYPHFYEADPYYLEKFEGLSPDKTKHQSFTILEPRTGVPLRAMGKLQMNVLLEPFDNIRLYENVPKLYFPALWFTEEAELPNFLLVILWIYQILPKICFYLGIIFITSGCVLIAFYLQKQKFYPRKYAFDSKITSKEMEVLTRTPDL